MKSHFKFFIGGKFKTPENVTCVSTSARGRWSGFLIEKYICGPQPPLKSFSGVKPHLLVVTKGESDAHWRASGGRFTSHWRPGTFVLLDAGYELDEVEFDQTREQLMVELDLEKFKKWTRDDSSQLMPLVPHVITEDLSAASFVRAMHDEVLNDCPSGRLFSESTSLALMSYLFSHYSIDRTSFRLLPQGLSAAKLQRLRDFIMSNLASDMNLDQLAIMADLSPQHLCRSFRQATGTTPYQYVIEARIEKAKTMLANGNLSIVEVALAVGFSSQSHFSETFRKRVGMSPRQFMRH